jgi:hypothetical protein
VAIGKANKERAMELRDIALAIVRARGSWEPIYLAKQPGRAKQIIHRALSFKDGELSIAYRTPFQRLPPLPQRVKVIAAMTNMPIEELPYGLDIWCPRKVLNIEWDAAGEVRIANFKRGKWELKLEAIGGDLG